MNFEHARAVADAVLLEGYALYPYRASAPKNQFRWPFGVLAPRAWSEGGGSEPWWMELQCLVHPASDVQVVGRLRFLHAWRRTVVDPHPDDARVPAWDEGRLEEIVLALMPPEGGEETFSVLGGSEVEPLSGGRCLIHTACHLTAVVAWRSEEIPLASGGEGPLVRWTIRVANHTAWDDASAPRDQILGASCLATHLVLEVAGGTFLSQIDPPPWAEPARAMCRSVRCFPVLAGPPGDQGLLLAAPIILYDHPQLAPESTGDFFDGCEIDELLALRTSTLTDAEKAEVRETDSRVRAILERVEGMAPPELERLHGALRDVSAGEMVPRPLDDPPRRAGPRHDPTAAAAAGMPPGTKVRLRPRPGTDAQDLLYTGLVATVEAVVRDVDGALHLLVTIDTDPARDLHRWYGRFHYYRLDEVDRLPGEAQP
jgi:hypothetical protein